jgi:hypothetical protein
MDLPDDDAWVDGAPTTGRDQSCAFCGTQDVAWVQEHRHHGADVNASNTAGSNPNASSALNATGSDPLDILRT